MERPFAPRGISENLTEELNSFIREHDFGKLYKSYYWRNDAYDAGFPDILRLEKRLMYETIPHQGTRLNDIFSEQGITLRNIDRVVEWGRPAKSRKHDIDIDNEFRSFFRTLEQKLLDHTVEEKPEEPARILDLSVKGIGPTYVSKVLRFALPVQYGAIDSRIVRVCVGCHRW